MKILRSAILAAGAATAILSTTTPASAATAAAFQGTATIGCFGCGTYGPTGNSASFTVVGVYGDIPMTGNAGTARYTVNEAAGTGCVVSGTASGTITVAGDPAGSRAFNWTRTGSFASITIAGGISATAAFVVTASSVPPCGASVTASFAGVANG